MRCVPKGLAHAKRKPSYWQEVASKVLLASFSPAWDCAKVRRFLPIVLSIMTFASAEIDSPVAIYLISSPCALSTCSEEGETKDDLELPTYPENFGDEIKKKFDEGLTLVRQEQMDPPAGRQPVAETHREGRVGVGCRARAALTGSIEMKRCYGGVFRGEGPLVQRNLGSRRRGLWSSFS